jgi:hypothetical protein
MSGLPLQAEITVPESKKNGKKFKEIGGRLPVALKGV